MSATALEQLVWQVVGPRRLRCHGCEQRVRDTLSELPGVREVEASAAQQRIAVRFDPARIAPERIGSAIAALGYDVSLCSAPSGHSDSRPPQQAGSTDIADPTPAAAPRELRLAVEQSEPAPTGAAREPQGTERLLLKINGMECSFCVGTITKALSQHSGVHHVAVNLAHEEALIEYEPTSVTATELKETLRALGYGVRDVGHERTAEEIEQALRTERRNLWLSASYAAIAANFMLLMWFDLLDMQRGWPFLIWLAPTLALSTMFGPGWRFLQAAWASLRRGILNQHVLMEFGAWAGLVGGFLAYVIEFPSSPWSRWLGVDYPVLFDFFGVVVFINTYHLLSAYVATVVRQRASEAVRRLLSLVPPTARVVRDGRELVVPVDEVRVGDLVRVRPGEAIPVDGVVVEGNSGVDEHLVTGESMPQEKTVGDEVIGGSLLQTGTLLIRATRVGADSFLKQVARQVEEARALKPTVLILVDQILQYYVPAVLACAVLAFLIWTLGAALFGAGPDWSRALLAALAVLVMGYPCALGMATPLAMIRGGGLAAERGILMRSAEAFQVLKDIRIVVLDKTGTITSGTPSLERVVAVGERAPEEVLRLAAAAEQHSEHPLAAAVVAAAERAQVALSAADAFEAVPGKGVRARIERRHVLVGKPGFVEEEGVELNEAAKTIATLQDSGATVSCVVVDGQLAGLLAFPDPLKPEAVAAIARLRALGLEPVMLTGDNERTARAVAHQVGIQQYRAEVLPGQKAEAIRAWQQGGRRVAMVGDGINDAPALMQADVGIALGSGTDIAIEAADVVIINDRLSAVVDAYLIGRESYRKTVQNLALAFAFNGIGVPLAITGLLHPVWAMIAMVASVTTVLANSFGGRLLRQLTQPPRHSAPSRTVPEATI